MKSKTEEVVVHVGNPSEAPNCRFHEICDRTRKCENFSRSGAGCGKGPTVYTWPPVAS